MATTKDSNVVDAPDMMIEGRSRWYISAWTQVRRHLRRDKYSGSLMINVITFTLPALYGTLSKLWVAKIDTSKVVTTDVYGYIGTIVEVLNEGLPRAAWTTIGDRTTRTTRSRIALAFTLISAQAVMGMIMMIVFVADAERLADAFVPVEVRKTSVKYVRIGSVQALSSAIEVAVSSSTGALDHPDVPLVLNSVKVTMNIILELLFISRFHVVKRTPTVEMQAWIRMGCDICAALCGLCYFLHIVHRLGKDRHWQQDQIIPSTRHLKILVRPGLWTFLESALRNAIYLWLVSGIISMGSDYATAFGCFNTIRWGLVMVPVTSLEQSTLAFVGHAWGAWRAKVGVNRTKGKATWKDELEITQVAWISCVIALVVEVPLCLFLSFWGLQSFAFYLSASDTVAKITQRMWKSIDWCYVFYALYTQFAAVLLATVPRWYFLQALGSNILWMMPLAIAVTRIDMTPQSAWTYHSVIFGGSLVFSFFVVTAVLSTWAWCLRKGKVRLQVVHSSL